LNRVEEKIEEGKTRCDPVKNPVATRWLLLFFLLKRRHFDLKNIKIDLDDPIKTRNRGLGPDWPPSWYENYAVDEVDKWNWY
jgi:hypothetical protein